MEGIEIVRKVYRNLRRPSGAQLPYADILETVREVIAAKKLDLTLNNNADAKQRTDWFRVNGRETPLDRKILIPLEVERRRCGDQCAKGENLHIVDYDVLNAAPAECAAFVGNSLVLSAHFSADYEYRIVYEGDFTDAIGLEEKINLPDFFAGMIADEATFSLIDLVDDDSEAWTVFVKSQNQKLVARIADWRGRWEKFVKHRRGKSVIKTTFKDRLLTGRPRFRGRY